jgi:hypothetical protein
VIVKEVNKNTLKMDVRGPEKGHDWIQVRAKTYG